MKLTFLGAAGTVTGSKYLLETEDNKIMIDCGLFQGEKELRLLNWQHPEFDPSSINMILLTHGHLDHTGYLPRLVKLGFKGKIYGAYGTMKIAEMNVSGIYNISGPDILSRYDFILKLCEVFNYNKELVRPITTASLKQPAPRPLNSGLIILKAQSELGFNPMDSLEGLRLLKVQLGY